MKYVGIDPGKTGAMVVIEGFNAKVYRVPLMVKGKSQPAWHQWAKEWSSALEGVDFIVIEQVGSRPGQGVSSTFNFGRNFGFVHALAASSKAAINFTTPTAWKNYYGLLKADKNASREMARQRFPTIEPEVKRVKDDGVAEALLLALYGREKVFNSGKVIFDL